MYIIESRHEWQIAHDAGVPTAFLGTHFPSPATHARFVLVITPLYAPDKAGGIGAFETSGCASKLPDAVYGIGWKNSRQIREMCSTEYFGPLPVIIRCFME
jgi:hypothetical protein